MGQSSPPVARAFVCGGTAFAFAFATTSPPPPQQQPGARVSHRPRAAACFLALSLRSAMLEFLLVVLAAAAAATTEAAEADSAASVAKGRPKGGAGNIM